MNRLLLALIASLPAFGALCAADEPLFPFVLPWDDASPGVTDLSGLLEKPAGGHGFIAAREGHLFAGDRRIRFFGVNTVFGANFPNHDDARKVAARMAKFGIGCVRFHHMDMAAEPSGIWSADLRTLDPGQLDKLDFFIAQLKAHGIYADLNLHVSRSYPGMPKWEHAPSFFKGVDTFYPPMIEMQREYARALLTHVNPYTKTAYSDEPAVAFVEINNENGLISEWWSGSLDDMSDCYRADFEKQWNRWLVEKDPSQQALQKAWGAANEPLGGEMLREGGIGAGVGAAWYLEQHEGAKAGGSPESAPGGGLRVTVNRPGNQGWHVQLMQTRLAFAKDKQYTLTFRAKADTARRIVVVAAQAHAPWQELASLTVNLTPEWKQYRFAFQPDEDERNGRIGFSNLSAATASFSFGCVSLRTGGLFGLEPGERLTAMPLFRKSGLAARTAAARQDWMRFLWDTEERYWTGMAGFIQHELKSRSLVVGSATGFSPAPIQAKLDVVDGHSYWQHPHFPHKPWDGDDWVVKNVSMAGAPDGGTIPGLALRRIAGKPFICTEYNASAPNGHSSEAFLLLSAYAALQDWDAIFAFAYSHRTDDWNARRVPGFFDLDQHPAKLATLPAAVSMFVRGDVARARDTVTVPVSIDTALAQCCRSAAWWDMRAFGTDPLAPLRSLTQMAIVPGVANPSLHRTANAGGDSSTVPSDTGELLWDSVNGAMTVNAPRAKAFVGRTTGGAIALGGVKLAPKPNRQGWAAITLTAVDGRDFKAPGRIVIAATGYAQNTGMRWKNATKESVGRDWGKAPSLVEGIGAKIELPVPASRLKAWALDECGQRRSEVPVKPGAPGESVASLEIGPKYNTLWYEVDVME